MEILPRINQLKTELDALRPLDAEREARIMQKFRLDWNFHSNHLEGNSLSYGETKALILFGITAQGKPLKDHLEMTGHNEALKWIEEVVQEERPLTENFIRQLHTLLLKEPYQVDAITPEGQPTKKWVKVGEYKTTPNNVITATGEPFYFATPEETPAKMHDLIAWYREQEEKSELHPLLLAAEFHYKFVRIHPFDDGNGRTARILMNFILMKHGLPPVIIKTQDKENYFAALRQADAGFLEPFIEYIGENLAHSLELMLKGAKGESIDEPDDVDKEIALLEQRLNSLGKNIEKTKSKETLLELHQKVLKPLLVELMSQNEKFKNFYKELSFEIQFPFPNGKHNYEVNSSLLINEVQQKLEKLGKVSIKGLRVIGKFLNFDKPGIEPFSYEQKIEIEFYKDYYVIDSKKKLYHQGLSQKEMKDIIREITKAHTAFINQKIEEAQQSTGDLQSPNE
jgi:Fic family protein